MPPARLADKSRTRRSPPEHGSSPLPSAVTAASHSMAAIWVMPSLMLVPCWMKRPVKSLRCRNVPWAMSRPTPASRGMGAPAAAGQDPGLGLAQHPLAAGRLSGRMQDRGSGLAHIECASAWRWRRSMTGRQRGAVKRSMTCTIMARCRAGSRSEQTSTFMLPGDEAFGKVLTRRQDLAKRREWMAVVDIWRNSVTGHQSEEFTWWNVLPDDERQRWTLEPFTSVGPLAFGMSPGEVSEALSGVTEETQRYVRSADRLDAINWTIEEGKYRKLGLRILYRQEQLAGVAVDALCGPQVLWRAWH
jgi:hypothetical protein